MEKRIKPKKIALVYCRGRERTTKELEQTVVADNCAQALEAFPDGIFTCEKGCLGFGSCVSACRLGAISMNQFGTAEVDSSKCVGCGLCVKACPKGIIHMLPPEYSIMPRCSNEDIGAAAKNACKVSCIACRLCVKNCPVDAIEIIDNCARINLARCVMCGMCTTKCPRKTIIDADGIFTDLF
ncbi:MAG: 4Fe-4S binding protein [Clostridiales Family XIII bacterium]|nr:4Fe-4S binding protein [Clostridiales Family XIII bacterium]